MDRKKKEAVSPCMGLWHIVSMDQWDEDYLNEEVQAYIEFKPNGMGDFQFGYVTGCIDWRPTTRDGSPAAEWTWEGGDKADGTPLTGRGWAVLEGDELHGMIIIHEGEESEFVAKKPKIKKPPKRK